MRGRSVHSGLRMIEMHLACTEALEEGKDEQC